jgi:hypothetical protein
LQVDAFKAAIGGGVWNNRFMLRVSADMPLDQAQDGFTGFGYVALVPRGKQRTAGNQKKK